MESKNQKKPATSAFTPITIRTDVRAGANTRIDGPGGGSGHLRCW